MASAVIAEGIAVVALWVLLRREVDDRAPARNRLREM
jgi:hypothetical protein